MNNKTTYLLGILVTLIVGALLQWYFCCNCNAKKDNCKATAVKKTVPEPDVKAIPFAFTDGDLSIKSQDNLNFFKSKHAIIQPVSEHLTTCLQELASYFKSHPNKTLKITGLYLEEEENLSNQDNLGLARAWAIQNSLESLGFPKHQIEIEGKRNNSLKLNVKNILFGPYIFEPSTKKEGNAKLLELKNKAEKHNTLIHFLPGRFYKTLSSQEQKWLRAVASYLNSSDVASCIVVGHTDSVGSEQSNIILGKKRAEFAKTELIKLKVNPKKIQTFSKGESSPIASNATKSGKAKNRRTELQLN